MRVVAVAVGVNFALLARLAAAGVVPVLVAVAVWEICTRRACDACPMLGWALPM